MFNMFFQHFGGWSAPTCSNISARSAEEIFNISAALEGKSTRNRHVSCRYRLRRPVEGEPAACVCAGGHLNLGQCQARAPAAACRRGRGPEANSPTFRRLWPDLRTQHARKNQHFGGSGLIHYPTCSQHLGAGRPTFNINISAETKQHQGRSL